MNVKHKELSGVLWDDIPAFRKELVAYLKPFGIALRPFARGRDAVREVRLRSRKIDLACVDVVDEREGFAPVGIDIVRDMRQGNQKLFIVAFTGYSDQLRQRLGLHAENVLEQAGADLVIGKGKLHTSFVKSVWTALMVKRATVTLRRNSPLDPASYVAQLVDTAGPHANLVNRRVLLRRITEMGTLAGYSGNALPTRNPNAVNYNAYLKDRGRLVRRYAGKWVAYHNGRQLVISETEDDAYRSARQVVPTGLVMLQPIVSRSAASVGVGTPKQVEDE